mgnify:CR=1 FL=1
MSNSEYSIETVCVQGSGTLHDRFGAISCPIYQNATFAHPALGHSTGYDYSRVANPTRDELQNTVALLEEGTASFAFSSGMAAITALMEIFAPGDHLIATDDLYGGTVRLWNNLSKKNGISVTYADTSDLAAVEQAFTKETKAIFLETPSNPMMKLADIKEIAKIASAHGALVIVDNTFLSPYLQKPLTLGADVVVHSGTKYLGGHNDVLAGFLVVKDDVLAGKIAEIYKTTGACLSPMDSWLVSRGIKTLALRMEKHQENARAIADWLKRQELVKEVYYVGIGGMISFRVGSAKIAEEILNHIRLIRFAESLGGVESLMTYPITQTHAEVPKEHRDALGVTETLLRMSVGIENVQDLIADLEQAFRKAAQNAAG